MRKRTALTLAALAGGGLAARRLAQDETLALLSEGYGFISERCRRTRSDVFETRLMLTRVVCMVGEEAAEVFYEPDRFTRKGALPQTTLRLLQDQGSVAVLDDETHRHRKRMFMSLMNPASRERLADAVGIRWRERLVEWEAMGEVVLHDEAREILCSAVCGWAGVPLAESEVEQRTREFAAMIEGAGTFGPRNWLGLLLRRRTERWIQDVVEKVRTGELDVPEESAAHVIAWHRDPEGELLDSEVAAVELLNLLRPTVAVAWYVTFVALALHDYPGSRQKLLAGDDGYDELFVQEVRRFYPFFPFVGGRVRDEFEWRGRRFAEGAWVLLDLYGTNHDARIWGDPEEFRPERFRDRDGSAYDFIPQGGGDHHEGHRCAGEWITIQLMKVAVRLLTRSIRYDVPEQDLRFRLSRMPAVPECRFVISNVRRTGG
jgi:fatty-acid peroxygenase